MFAPPHFRKSARRAPRFDDIAGTFAAVFFFGAAILLIAGAFDRSGEQTHQPPYVAAEDLPEACRTISQSVLFDPIPPHVVELCAHYL